MDNIKEKMMGLTRIIAVDFDGTLVEDKYPSIGKKNNDLFESLIYIRNSLQWFVILWTCRTGKALDEAVKYCKDNGLEFDAVNKNVKEVIDLFGEDTRKVYANIYLDDKATKPIGIVQEEQEECL